MFLWNLVFLINYLRVSYGFACESAHTHTHTHTQSHTRVQSDIVNLKPLHYTKQCRVKATVVCTNTETSEIREKASQIWPPPVRTYTATLRPTPGLATRLQPSYLVLSPSYVSRQQWKYSNSQEEGLGSLWAQLGLDTHERYHKMLTFLISIGNYAFIQRGVKAVIFTTKCHQSKVCQVDVTLWSQW